MPRSLAAHQPSDPVRTLENIRPRMAQADLERSDLVGSSDQFGLTYGAVAREAVVKHYGSVKAAAISLGNVDPSLMVRELEGGKFQRLEHAQDAARLKAAVSEALYKAFTPLTDPKDAARQMCDQVQALVNGIRQFIDAV